MPENGRKSAVIDRRYKRRGTNLTQSRQGRQEPLSRNVAVGQASRVLRASPRHVLRALCVKACSFLCSRAEETSRQGRQEPLSRNVAVGQASRLSLTLKKPCVRETSRSDHGPSPIGEGSA